ncbi:MAG: hypothetical protein K6G75_12990 [Lachnospiraceae bacterium]|nr:hypothetical protein [Lachnospiraceae bacterium]
MMTKLREIRLQVVTFLSRFEAYLVPAGKLILAMVVFCTINAKFGYMTKIAKFPLALILGLFCSFMPLNMIVVIGALLTLLHAYAISIEFAATLAVVYVIMFLLFFRFSPKDTMAVILTPLCFVFHIPYVVPMSFGLVGSFSSSVSVACGTVVFYVLKYMVSASKVFAESGEDDTIARLKALLEGLIKNKEMLICAAAFALVVMVVYVIRRLSINYAWTIAMIMGALIGILTILVGDIMYKTDISIPGLIIGTVIACVVVKIIQFLVFDVDYSRTEKVQFEDDDYYYYVKAVPKISGGNVKDNRDVSEKKKKKKEAKEKNPAREESVKSRVSEQSSEEDAQENVQSVRRSAQRPSTASRRSTSDADSEFSREKAVYEARQAEVARRREAARRREERLRNEQIEENDSRSDDIVQEEDNDLGLSRRMAYQRRKLEERISRDSK